ncbi:MAG: hypothetical protein WCA31_09615, partial [Acidimicrobiales bacterium]
STSERTHVAKAKTKKVAFKGSYSGNISMLWSSNSVSVTSASGTGTSTELGASTLSGTGTSSPSSTCDPFSGSGTISGGGSVIHFKIVSSSAQQACAAGSAAPTSVDVKGVATVVSGTGKYAGATGSLKIAGSFSIKSTTAGSSESDAFTATLTGTLTVKG